MKRAIFPILKNHLDKTEITLLIGARQVGKTTLLEQLKDYLTSKNEISFFYLSKITPF